MTEASTVTVYSFGKDNLTWTVSKNNLECRTFEGSPASTHGNPLRPYEEYVVMVVCVFVCFL